MQTSITASLQELTWLKGSLLNADINNGSSIIMGLWYQGTWIIYIFYSWSNQLLEHGKNYNFPM